MFSIDVGDGLDNTDGKCFLGAARQDRAIEEYQNSINQRHHYGSIKNF